MRISRIFLSFYLIAMFVVSLPLRAQTSLDDAWKNPPVEGRIRAYWWWLNGNVTREAITRDLEQMREKGFGGAVIFDAGGAAQDGNNNVPAGPVFGSGAWRELLKHSVKEADRLGMVLSLNIQSGWNLGGPGVKAEHAAELVVFSETTVTGGQPVSVQLETPKLPAKNHRNFYRDIATVAYPHKEVKRKPIKDLAYKNASREVNLSAPDGWRFLVDEADTLGEEDCAIKDIIELSDKVDAKGNLTWSAPPGDWTILRFGCALSGATTSTSSPGGDGLALNYLDPQALETYWNSVVQPLLDDNKPFLGKALKYIHTDSWECGGMNWSPRFREEFKSRRGYDLGKYLPAVAGKIIDDRSTTMRFLADFRKTVGDLAADYHYTLMHDLAARQGMQIHPEAGGPHGAPIDSLRLLGLCDIPMSEFWAKSWKHRTKPSDKFFAKQPASAAHTYGHTLVAAEGFTTIGPHWEESYWSNLKPSFDQAACEGVNLLFWHAFTCSPAEMGTPGQSYFAGTHINPNLTTWNQSAAFFAYLNRCQAMLQRGQFVADVIYYYGDHVPNFTQLKSADPAKVLPGFDYDVATEQVLLDRMSVKDGRIVLPDGMSYRLLVLPDQPIMSLAALKKIKTLVDQGATVVGPQPQRLTGLGASPQDSDQFTTIATGLWAGGKIITGKIAHDLLSEKNAQPDFTAPASDIDYIHRRDGDADIYFIASQQSSATVGNFSFRVTGRQPEIFDPVSGETRPATRWNCTDTATTLPLEIGPYGSLFVVFRKPAQPAPAGKPNFPELIDLAGIDGPWKVQFDPKMRGPGEAITFDQLKSWTERPEKAVRSYSGTAVYSIQFDLGQTPPDKELILDLGEIGELAEVKLNGKDMGIVWNRPAQVKVTGVLQKSNTLEIAITNCWINRLLADQALGNEQRPTKTNIVFKKDNKPMASGLLGPVTIKVAEYR